MSTEVFMEILDDPEASAVVSSNDGAIVLEIQVQNDASVQSLVVQEFIELSEQGPTGDPYSGTGGTSGDPVDWASVINKPTTFTPSAHTQTSSTITDFTESVQDAVAALLGAGSNITLNYDDGANTLTVTSAGGSAGLDVEAVRDAIGVALVGVGNISIVVNDAADTITITTTATVNSTDAVLKDRANHTGAQAISTVTNLQTTLDAKVLRTTTRQNTTPAVVETSYTDTVTALNTNTLNMMQHFVNMKASVGGVAANMVSWLNEWGALRGTSPYTFGDALVRGIRETGDGITAGNVLELTDRRSTPIVMWGRSWIDGSLRRNGIKHTDVYVTTDYASDSNIANLPAGTLIVEVAP